MTKQKPPITLYVFTAVLVALAFLILYKWPEFVIMSAFLLVIPILLLPRKNSVLYLLPFIAFTILCILLYLRPDEKFQLFIFALTYSMANSLCAIKMKEKSKEPFLPKSLLPKLTLKDISTSLTVLCGMALFYFLIFTISVEKFEELIHTPHFLGIAWLFMGNIYLMSYLKNKRKTKQPLPKTTETLENAQDSI